MSARLTFLALAAIVVSTAGCARFGEETPYPGAGESCPTAMPAPIAASEARTILRRHGFTVEADDRWCGLDLISTLLTNASSSFLADTVMRRKGLLNCYVLAAPGADRGVRGDTLAASAERRLANLDCDLYGAEAKGFRRHVARLDRAFAELRRNVVRQPSRAGNA